MTERLQIFKCESCENIVEVVHGGAGELVCCAKPMKHMVANTVDAAKEKHVPVIEKNGEAYTVKVGSVEHPMTEEHYIEWVELSAGDALYKHYLKPGIKPQADFVLKADKVTAREYCNLHGLWKSGN